MWRSILFSLAGLGLGLDFSTASGQEAVPVPGPVSPTAPVTPTPERERTIYVPYEQLEKVFEDGGKGVFLPYKEFLELWQQLELKRTEEEVKAPQDGVVSRAEVKGRMDGETLVMDGVVAVESFKKGWLTLPFSRAQGGPGLGLSEAETGAAVLRPGPDGYDVLLPDKGRYELKLKMYAGLKREAGKQSVALVLPKATVSRFEMVVQGTGWTFGVSPAAAFTSQEEAGNTRLVLLGGSGGKFDINWHKREAETALAPLLLASSQISAEVQAGSLVTRANIDLRILRAAVPRVVLLVPTGQQVMSVSGADLKDWNLEEAGGQQRLILTPNAPVKEGWKLGVVLEGSLPKLPGEVVVPEVVVEGAAQQRGEINVLAEGHLDVTPKPGGGVVQRTQSAAAGEKRSLALTPVGGYRFLQQPAKLTLGVTEAKPQVDVDSVSLLTVRRDGRRVESVFNYAIRRVGIFEARIDLPAGWTGWEVVGIPAERWMVEGAANGQAGTLVMKVEKQTLGQLSFRVRAQAQRGSAMEEVSAPVFVPQGVARHDAKVGVAVQTSLEVSTKQLGDLRQEDVSSPNIASHSGVAADTFGGAPNQSVQSAVGLAVSEGTELTLAFRYRDAVKNTATLGFKAREPQVNVEVLTLVEAREQSLRHQWTLAFDVAYAGMDRFVLAVPKVVADDIRFVDASVKEINKSYQPEEKLVKALPDAEQRVFWEVVLRSEKMSQFALSLSVERPLPTEANTALQLLTVHVPGAFQETAQVAVVKEEALEIRDYKVENLEEIDPAELNPKLGKPGVLLAFKSRSQPVKLALNVSRNAYIPVPQAVVTHAVLTSAVATDGAQTNEMIYWVRNNAQQFLAVALPAKARLVSDIFVDGATQQPMKREGSEDLLIRLPAGSGSASRSIPLRFVYEVPSEKPGTKLGMMGSLVILPPKLTNVEVVMESHARLFLPERQDYTGFYGAMTQSLKDRGWGRVRRVLDQVIPSFGPQLVRPADDWQSAPTIPESQKAAFDFKVPTQGQDFRLHRLGAPDTITVKFRSSKLSFFYEGLVFVLVLLAGVRLMKAPLQKKVAYACVAGAVALLLTGLVGAANGVVVQAGALAVLIVWVLWMLPAIPLLLRTLTKAGVFPILLTGGVILLGFAWLIAIASEEDHLVALAVVMTLGLGAVSVIWLVVKRLRKKQQLELAAAGGAADQPQN